MTVTMALVATLGTWAMTAVGAATVFICNNVNQKAMDCMVGYAAGVMLSTSFWGLLSPAMATEDGAVRAWAVVAGGFMLGGVVMKLVELLLNRMHASSAKSSKTHFERGALLIVAIVLHNIPEGLVIGIAFGTLGHENSTTAAGATAIAIGIGIQNLPEGAAISLPLKERGFSQMRAFMYGQLSGFVEVVSGVIGAVCAESLERSLPLVLSAAAGAMVYVAAGELIPESQMRQRSSAVTLATMSGFTLMMILDSTL